MSNMNHAAFAQAGLQELSFGEIDLVNGAVDWGQVASDAMEGATIGLVAGAAGGAAAGAMAGGVGAGPGAAAGGVAGAVGGAVAGALGAIFDTWGD